MTLEILRDSHARWLAKDDDSFVTGYGGSLLDAVRQWAQNYENHVVAKAARMREHAQMQRLDASIA